MRIFSRLVVVVALAAGMLAVACGDDEKTFKIPGEDGGEVTFSEDLPDEFPKDFPVYKGADFQGGARGSSDGIEGIVATWETKDSLDKVKDFYDEEFKDGEWTEESSGELGGESVFWVVKNKDGSKAGYVNASRDGDRTTIIVTVGDSDDLTGGDGSSDTSDTPDDAADDGSEDEEPTPAEEEATLPDEVDLSDDFPTDRVPLPDDIRITSSSSITSGGSTMFIVEFYTKDSVQDVADFFESQLTAKGWTQVFSTSSDGEVVATYAPEGEDASAAGINVVIGPAEVDGYAKVGLTVSLE